MHSKEYIEAVEKLREDVNGRKNYLEDHWDHESDPDLKKITQLSHLEEILDEMEREGETL